MLTKQEKKWLEERKKRTNIVILVRIGLAIMNCALLVVPEVCTGCLFIQTTATPPSSRRGWRWLPQLARSLVLWTTSYLCWAVNVLRVREKNAFALALALPTAG